MRSRAETMIRLTSVTCSIGLPSMPVCSLRVVSLQRARAFSQKIAR